MNNQIKNYAKLIVTKGVNVQPQQPVIIAGQTENYEFIRLLVAESYAAGAKSVNVFWGDEVTQRLDYENQSIEELSNIASWKYEPQLDAAQNKAAYISVRGLNPDEMNNVPANKMMAHLNALSAKTTYFKEKLMNDEFQWCVVSVPSKKWANKVFNNVENSTELLWEAILKANRCDLDDPFTAWEIHDRNLTAYAAFLNAKQFKLLRYKNDLGTDIEVGLPKNHLWLGGGGDSIDGVYFIANLPTEEVFTMPNKHQINGKVVASKPLNYNGSLIDNFSLTFEKGKVIDCQAECGEEILKQLIATDAGSLSLGEVALVSHDSAISKSDILFYDTGFDENASCHFALGAAYPTCIVNGGNMTSEEKELHGVNTSSIHVDFMFGDASMNIVGITDNNEEITIFENGNFTI